MKRSIAMCLIVCVVLGACFANGQNEEAASPVMTLEFANDKMGGVDYSVRAKVEKQATETTGVQVNITASPDVAAYQTTIQQSIRTAKAPGLFTWWGGSQLGTLVSNGLVEDLTSVWEDFLIPQGVAPALAKPFTFDGKIYAVPYSVPYTAVFYNKAAFARAGISSEPQTFTEFLSACDALKAAGITPIVLKNDSWAGFLWFQQILASFDPALYSGVCDGTVAFTDPQVIEAMDAWKSMIDKGYFSKTFAFADVKKKMAIGEIGMMLDTTTHIKSLVNDYGMVSGEDLGVFQLPSATGKRSAVFFEENPICVAKASAMEPAAMKALETWYTQDLQECLYDSFGVVGNGSITISDPTYNEVLGYTTQPENYEVLYRFYENAPEPVRNVALDAFMKFQMGNSTVMEMLTTCQKASDAYWK
ncbi:MAG: extracellular solute-binding protein [Sphaerochaetaceae bacterium]|nr:extracellular solute-binding protein [Sphaerochaetaceae bacterium]